MTAPFTYLFMRVVVADHAGDPDADALIASTLGVSSLSYTSNDADAQTLLPAGWSWSLDDQENIVAVRASDGLTYGLRGWDTDQNPTFSSDVRTHCIIAVRAQLKESGER